MSTYWHVECVSHEPKISSDGEISQHTDYMLDVTRRLWEHRASLLYFERFIEHHDLGEYQPGADTYFSRNAWRFIRQHPDCTVQLRSEYGDVQSIGVPPVVRDGDEGTRE